jgi:hypothetical protein
MEETRRNRRQQMRNRLAAWERPITLRLALPADLAALERLAQLDSRHLPPGPHLLAERDRRIDAAISLATGEQIADPFRRTAELCALLHCHAGGERLAAERDPAPPLRPKPRLATA